MIQLYLGYGKGKTSAAVGAAIRMLGNGGKVLFVQFLKGNRTGEIEVLSDNENVKIIRLKKNYGFVSRMNDDDMRQLIEEHNCILKDVLEFINNYKPDMVVLDELGDAITLNAINQDLINDFIEKIIKISKEKVQMEVIVTGHKEVDILVEAADYYTSFNKVKHPYDKGVKARKGIEY